MSSEYYGTPPEMKEAIRSEHKEARTAIEHAATRGNYLLSERAATTLSELVQRLRKSSPEPYSWSEWFAELSGDLKAARDCLKVMREEAKLDLQVK